MPEKGVWDVIIVGGGPAGSTTARYAAEGGLKVLVVDGRDPIGSPLQPNWVSLTMWRVSAD